MRTIMMATIFGSIVVGAALARAEDVASTVAKVRYPPLAEHARIQGDVHIEVQAGVVALISGHPLLREVAIETTKLLGSMNNQTSFDLTYHFVLADTATGVPTSTTVKRGNALERAILRVFGFKTEKVVQSYQCESGVAPANRVKTDGGGVEVWIYGRSFCLETETGVRVARR